MLNYLGGHVCIPKIMLEQIAKMELTYRQRFIFLFLLSDSLGWQRATTNDQPASAIAEKTGIAPTHVSADLRVIIKKGYMTIARAASGVHGARYRIPMVAELGFPDQTGGLTETVRVTPKVTQSMTETVTLSDRNSQRSMTETVTPDRPKRSPSKNVLNNDKECSKEGSGFYKNPSENKNLEPSIGWAAHLKAEREKRTARYAQQQRNYDHWVGAAHE